jgi:TRAP transporter TAXI family solute receptor
MQRITAFLILLILPLMVLVLPQPKSERVTFSIATGSPSGLYFPFGGGLASIWSKAYPDINVKAEVTSASVSNIIQVSRGESEAGISQGDALRNAVAGNGQFTKQMPVRVLLALYPNVVHLATLKDSDIHSLDDLEGKKVSLGAPGSGNYVTSRNILKALDIPLESFSPQYLNYTETTDALKNGTIDAGFIVGGLGLAAMAELALTREIRIVEFSDAEIEKIGSQHAAYTGFTIEPDFYHKVQEPVQTATLWNFLIVKEDMPDKLAMRLTKAALEKQKQLESITRAAKYMTPENTLKFAEDILHEGAAKVLKYNPSSSGLTRGSLENGNRFPDQDSISMPSHRLRLVRE